MRLVDNQIGWVSKLFSLRRYVRNVMVFYQSPFED